MLRQENAGTGVTLEQKPGAALPGGVRSGAVMSEGIVANQALNPVRQTRSDGELSG